MLLTQGPGGLVSLLENVIVHPALKHVIGDLRPPDVPNDIINLRPPSPGPNPGLYPWPGAKAYQHEVRGETGQPREPVHLAQCPPGLKLNFVVLVPVHVLQLLEE